MEKDDLSILLRICKNVKLKSNTDLDDYICCLCMNNIDDKNTMIYICKKCKKCFCLYQSNICYGFFMYLSYGWKTCPMCKIEI